MTLEIIKAIGRLEGKFDQHKIDIKADMQEVKENIKVLEAEVTKSKGFVAGAKWVVGGVFIALGTAAKVIFGKL